MQLKAKKSWHEARRIGSLRFFYSTLPYYMQLVLYEVPQGNSGGVKLVFPLVLYLSHAQPTVFFVMRLKIYIFKLLL